MIKFNLNEENIAEYIIDNNSKKNIVFIHGYTSRFESREKIYKLFNNYNWYGIDFPNHGNSTIINQDKLRLSYFVKLILKFIKKHNLKDFIIIGHSMGGAVASIVASILSTKAKLLILEGPANLSVLKNKKIIEKMIPNTEEDMKIAYVNMIYKYKINPNSEELNQIIKKDFHNLSQATKALNIMLEEKIWFEAMNLTQKAMQKLNIKTILIFGDQDNIVPYEESIKLLKKDIKNLRIEIIKNTSHLPYIENEKKYLEILKKYL